MLIEENVFHFLPLMCNSPNFEAFPKGKKEGKGKILQPWPTYVNCVFLCFSS